MSETYFHCRDCNTYTDDPTYEYRTASYYDYQIKCPKCDSYDLIPISEECFERQELKKECYENIQGIAKCTDDLDYYIFQPFEDGELSWSTAYSLCKVLVQCGLKAYYERRFPLGTTVEIYHSPDCPNGTRGKIKEIELVDTGIDYYCVVHCTLDDGSEITLLPDHYFKEVTE